jgi:hypothetical protein
MRSTGSACEGNGMNWKIVPRTEGQAAIRQFHRPQERPASRNGGSYRCLALFCESVVRCRETLRTTSFEPEQTQGLTIAAGQRSGAMFGSHPDVQVQRDRMGVREDN